MARRGAWLAASAVAACALSALVGAAGRRVWLRWTSRTLSSAFARVWPPRRLRRRPHAALSSSLDLIGCTPLLELSSLSAQTGCRVLAKAEFLNPGGSAKDRVAAAIVAEAEHAGALAPGGTVVEATAGSTGESACRRRRALAAAVDVRPAHMQESAWRSSARRAGISATWSRRTTSRSRSRSSSAPSALRLS